MVGSKLAPVAQSVSALYLYGSKAPKKCGGCEFEPHLGQKHFLSLSQPICREPWVNIPWSVDLQILTTLELNIQNKHQDADFFFLFTNDKRYDVKL